ncbi:neural proliferation differentiation and control protein 1-like [Salvelinus alpinus]
MMLSKRIERQPRHSLLPVVLLCFILTTVRASMPAGGKCPHHIDCAREGRHFCKPGTSYCGPCLTPLEENEEGQCVARKRRHHHGKVTAFSNLDEEIDFLQSVIAKQEVSEVKQSKQSDTPSKAVPMTQTKSPRQRGKAQPSAEQPTTAHPSTRTPQPDPGALERVGPGGPGGPIAIPYPSKDSLLVSKVTAFSNLDEEIDFLQSVIAKQEVSEVKQSKQSDTPSKAVPMTQTKSPRQRGKAQPSAEQPTTAHPSTRTPQPDPGALERVGPGGPGGPIAIPYPSKDSLLVIMISVCIIFGTVALILATVCWVRLQKESRLAQKVDYPAFGSNGNGTANRTSSGDKKLAQSAQMYHYQHQKQQMLSMEKHKSETKVTDSEVTSDEEEVGGDFTVYECPGLAPTGEMEVKNPLFDDSTLYYQGNPKGIP